MPGGKNPNLLSLKMDQPESMCVVYCNHIWTMYHAFRLFCGYLDWKKNPLELSRTRDAQWRKPFFSLKSRTFGLGQTNWADKFWGIWDILVQWFPCPCFPLFNHYFYKKLSLYIHIPNIYLGFGYKRLSFFVKITVE